MPARCERPALRTNVWWAHGRKLQGLLSASLADVSSILTVGYTPDSDRYELGVQRFFPERLPNKPLHFVFSLDRNGAKA